jgi:methyl-accepting chemotaxis protein
MGKMNLTIGKKIFLSFVLIIFIFGAMIVYSYINIKKVQELTQEVKPITVQMVDYQKISLELGAFERSFDQYVVVWDVTNKDAVTLALKNMKTVTDNLLSNGISDSTRGGVTELNQKITELTVDFGELSNLDHNVEKTKMTNIILKIYPEIVSIREKQQNLLLDTQKIVETNTDSQIAITDRVLSQFMIIGIISAIIAVILSIIISMSISRPIIKLRNTATEVGKGNLDIQTDIKSGDEIGELASAFNEMTKKLKQSKQELQDYGAELEKKVALRTMEFKKKIEELESKKKK